MIERLKAWWGSFQVRWASKTLWFNIISAVLTGMEIHFQFLRPVLDDGVYGVAAFTIAMVNIVLRFVTNQPMVVRAPQDEAERTI